MKRYLDRAFVGLKLNLRNQQPHQLGLLARAERSPNVIEIGECRGDVGFIDSLLADLVDSRRGRSEFDLCFGHPQM